MKYRQLTTTKNNNKGTTRIDFMGFWNNNKQDSKMLKGEAEIFMDILNKYELQSSISKDNYSGIIFVDVIFESGFVAEGRKELQKAYKEYWDDFKANFPIEK